jgi:hypothetical protein
VSPRLWSISRAADLVLATLCALGFVVALVAGAGWASVVFLVAAAFWLAVGAWAGRRARRG